jgi:NAD(P)-dependent dehydrogenase (short-subunit alcohol dehydrogenase family)
MIVPLMTFIFFALIAFLADKRKRREYSAEYSAEYGIFNMDRMKGRTCIVLGASRGMGRGIARGLGEAGAHVIAVARSEQALRLLQTEIISCAGQCTYIVTDLSNTDNVREIFEMYPDADMCVISTFSAVYDLMNTMGKVSWDISKGDPGEFWDKVNNMGLRANFIASTEYCRSIVSDKKHVLVNVSSWGGQMPVIDSAYGIGKAGLDRLGVEFHIAGKSKNIHSVVLYPGLVITEQTGGHIHASNYQDMETPLYSGRIMPYLYNNASSYSGKIAITAELAKIDDIYDEYGKQPLSLRSAQSILNRIPLIKYLSWFVQCDIYIPLLMIQMVGKYGFAMKYQ